MSKLPFGFALLFLVLARGVRSAGRCGKTCCKASANCAKSAGKNTHDAAKAPAKSATLADHLDLETTVVSGNRELPKVLYIVPWKKAELGELPGQPFNTLLDEVLRPVDREVFKREVKYYHTVTNGANPTPPKKTA